MSLCLYVCMHLYVYVCMCTCMCMHMYMSIDVCTCRPERLQQYSIVQCSVVQYSVVQHSIVCHSLIYLLLFVFRRGNKNPPISRKLSCGRMYSTYIVYGIDIVQIQYRYSIWYSKHTILQALSSLSARDSVRRRPTASRSWALPCFK